MNRTILAAIAVLAFNIIIGLCAAIAIFSVFFRYDPVTAIVFGIIAFVGILPQPWFLLLLMLPGGVFYAPVAATIITLWVYRQLERRGLLRTQLARLKSMRLAHVLNGCVIVVALLAGIAYARVLDLPALNNHAPRVIAHDITVQGIQHNRSYCIADFFNSEWLWQARVTPQQMTALCTQYHMRPIATDQLPKDFFDKSPYWWQPKVTPTAHAYATEAFPVVAGAEGMQMMALWDQQSQRLYMWIMCIF